MITFRQFRPLLWPTLATLLGLTVLFGLGTWQLKRLAAKEATIARIASRAQAVPLDLAEALRIWRETSDIDYHRLRIEGRFLHNRERHYVWAAGREVGWRVITPLKTDSGAVVMVDRGFVPNALKEPAARHAGRIEGMVEIVGLARAPGIKGLFTPDNEPARNMWYWRDLETMAKGAASEGPPAPFFVEAVRADVPGGWPRAGATRLELSNRHLEYALTWYGLAIALLTVFVFFARSRLWPS